MKVNSRFLSSRRLVMLVAILTTAASFEIASAKTNTSPESVVVRGEPLSKGLAKTVDACVQEGAKLDGKVVKMTGTVKQVCKAKGCWFTLAGKGNETVRITSQGYKFFVPTNADGRLATVEGVFSVKELSAEMAQHYEDDRVAGTKEVPRKITTAAKEFSLAATAVELK
jgi:hypothetical protein